ncbi:MAG: CPBP family intramembrane metalloprotease [Phycisphaerales bacterium]|nr:CPBP family intramembrane metalloprotease [Phycisphaerales bacterium]
MDYQREPESVTDQPASGDAGLPPLGSPTPESPTLQSSPSQSSPSQPPPSAPFQELTFDTPPEGAPDARGIAAPSIEAAGSARVVVVPWARPLQHPGLVRAPADGQPADDHFPYPRMPFIPQRRPDGTFAADLVVPAGGTFPADPGGPMSGIAVGPASPVEDPDPMLLRRMGRWAALADAGILVAAALLTEIALGIAFAVLNGAPLDADGELDMAAMKPWMLPMVTVRAGLLTLLILLLCRVRGQRVAAVGMTVRRLALNVVLGVGVCGVVYGFLLAFVMVVMLLVPELREQMEANQGKLHDMLPELSLAGFLWLAILIGFYEELIFRGFLMPRLRRCFGSWIPAVLVSTVVFTALHAFDQVAAALPLIAMLSLAFSLVTIWRRSIVPAIVAHALFDFSQFALMYWAMQHGPGGGTV